MAILSFKHAGLARFARTGDTSGIVSKHALKLNQLLARLSFSGGFSGSLREIPGFHSIRLKFQSETYAVKVTASWRLTFKVSGSDLYDLDYVQYH